MGMFWLFGFIGIILYNVFNAGVNAKTLFYSMERQYGGTARSTFNEGLLIVYLITTLGIALTWPVSVPLIVVYRLGKRFAKES